MWHILKVLKLESLVLIINNSMIDIICLITETPSLNLRVGKFSGVPVYLNENHYVIVDIPNYLFVAVDYSTGIGFATGKTYSDCQALAVDRILNHNEKRLKNINFQKELATLRGIKFPLNQ